MDPLIKIRSKPYMNLTLHQSQAIQNIKKLIETNELKLMNNSCLCKNSSTDRDILVSECDRYGIPVSNWICSKCGIIRSGQVFDKKSNTDFYRNFYRDIYVGQAEPTDTFFADQVSRGQQLYSLVKSNVPFDKVQIVVEIGCGAGGISYPFFKAGKTCMGLDFDERYLNLGRKFGLNLINGDFATELADESADLLILSHVMEHFTNPIEEMIAVIMKIAAGKYLLVEVPGIFFIERTYYRPIFYFQNAHVFNYYYDYLVIFFNTLGLNYIYGDEKCTFILQKPTNWTPPAVDSIYSDPLSLYPERIRRYIAKIDLKFKFKLNYWLWRKLFVNMAKKSGLKKIKMPF